MQTLIGNISKHIQIHNIDQIKFIILWFIQLMQKTVGMTSFGKRIQIYIKPKSNWNCANDLMTINTSRKTKLELQ